MKLKTGDRVKVKRGVFEGSKGLVKQINPENQNDTIVVLDRDKSFGAFEELPHELLIRLKPKRKPREFWLAPCGPNNLDALDHDPRLKHPNANWNGVIHVREVIGKGDGK